MVAVTTDCYAILGVAPTAEDVVIRAAYRALMRHYHPDSNRDPEAQARAQAITAAYAVLRDPAKRAEYDAWRKGGGEGAWLAEDLPPPPAEPPAMRAAGIGAAVLAVAMVGVVWAWPREELPRNAAPQPRTSQEAISDIAVDHPTPIAELEPESERLADLHRELQPDIAPVPIDLQDVPAEIVPERPASAPQPARVRAVTARRTPAPATSAPQRSARSAPASNDKLATLERMSDGFFNQSMNHADAEQKKLLVAARDRFAAKRKACRSQSCVADGYVRQIRETGLIMESRAQPGK